MLSRLHKPFIATAAARCFHFSPSDNFGTGTGLFLICLHGPTLQGAEIILQGRHKAAEQTARRASTMYYAAARYFTVKHDER